MVDGPSTDPYLGKKILDQFRLERVVGSGGMGVVYEGLDEGLGRRVAVKILHRDLVTNKDIVQRFHREAQIAHQLDHPGIVRVVLFGQLADGNLYLVLEFLEGPTLMQALEADRVFAPVRAVKVMCDVADAVTRIRESKPHIKRRREQNAAFNAAASKVVVCCPWSDKGPAAGPGRGAHEGCDGPLGALRTPQDALPRAALRHDGVALGPP